MRDLIAGDCEGYLTFFLETGSGLHNAGHIQRDSSGIIVDIKVSANSFPFINDWNEDGKKDLIVGETSPVPPSTGNVRVYENVGTNSNPAFRNHSLVYAGSEPLFLDRSMPVVYDLDQDSVKDLICGTTNGFLYFFKNLGTNALPVFAAAYETLQTTGSIFIDALTMSRPNLIDWTGDADLDIVLGGQDGYVWICENAGFVNADEAANNANTNMRMLQIAPNPFSKSVQIQFAIRNPQSAMSLKIYDATGRLIKDLLPSAYSLLPTAVTWSGTDQTGSPVPAGVYFVKLEINGQQSIQKVILLK